MALQAIARQVVDRRKENQAPEPKQNSRPINVEKNGGEDHLCDGNVQGQTSKLIVRSAGAEQERAFARIEAVNVSVGNVVPAIDDEAKRERHIDQTEPKCLRMENVPLSERKQIEPDRGQP